jgi:phosphate ABC transporter phosphate-binding protein
MTAHATAPRLWHPGRIVAFGIGLLMLVGGVFGTLSPAQAAGTVHAPIVGSGSTWSANALQAWIGNVWANYQWKISYSESGSTQGRNEFKNGTADFGVSEIPYDIQNSNEGDPRPARDFAYMPIVAGGTAFMYNLEIAGKRVTNLRLSGENLARIFTGELTTWNDQRIKDDNPGLAANLPAIPIVPVVRSDGSGTSAQFSLYLRQEQASLWDAYCGKVGRPMVNGHCGVTSNWPTVAGSGMVSRAGANGVAGYVAQSHAVGSITFVEYAYALNSGFPVVKMLNASGYYTEPAAGNVAVALLSARINEDDRSIDYLTQDLSLVYGSADARTYPLSSYSYIILPTKVESGFTENKGLTLADFGAYFLCEGQQSADVLGYSPLPINLVTRGYEQVLKVPGGNPTVKDPVRDCNNPTFSPDGTNRVANETAFPEPCDQRGPQQCTRGTGGARGSNFDGGAAGAADAGGTGGTDANAAGAAGTVTGPNAASSGNASAGGVTIDDKVTLVQAAPQTIPGAGTGTVAAVTMAAGGLGILAAAALPPFLGKRRGTTGRREMPHQPRGRNR